MPITPLHLGPGLVLKAVVGKRISITVFALSQIFMDLEVIGRLALDADRLHGFTRACLSFIYTAVAAERPSIKAQRAWFGHSK